jgi:6-pyruvoyltetrahydropterin/6-carboxytetrahydropterin synthase
LMNYAVTKSFRFCYAHRLVGDTGKCWHLHGHTAKVEIEVQSNKLDETGMVVNFEVIQQKMGEWIAKELDHRAILYKEDPIAKLLLENGETCVVIDSNPTAENLARLIFQAARREGINASRVRFWESDTSLAEYTE